MYNIAIVEDNKEDVSLLQKYLARFAKENALDFQITVYFNALDFLSKYRADYDIVFMDIEMPGLNGMEAAKELRKMDKVVTLVFVTNMAKYAIKGYEVEAFDFIVKPISYYDFLLKIKRILQKMDHKRGIDFKIKTLDGIVGLNSGKLLYVESMQHRLLYHYKEETYTCYGSLKKAEELLSGEGFFRCNNCYLVNLRYVESVTGYTAKVGGDELQISHPRKNAFLQALGEYFGN